jgi:hypothetical protein
MQRLLNFYRWDAGAVRDELRSSVLEQLGDRAGVVVADLCRHSDYADVEPNSAGGPVRIFPSRVKCGLRPPPLVAGPVRSSLRCGRPARRRRTTKGPVTEDEIPQATEPCDI